MRNHTSVRKPSLAHSKVRKNKDKVLSVGDTLRKAKKNLLVGRIVWSILAVMVVAVIVVAIVLGYADAFIDNILEMMG